jgi:hypothetical protein
MIIDFIFKKFGTLFAILILFALCRNCANDYTKGANEEVIKNYELMIKEQKTTEATLESLYTERTVKILGVPAKFYDFKYKFTLDGSVYNGEAKNLIEKPKTNSIKVYYSSKDPNYNSNNPKEILESEKDKRSNSSLYFSIFFGFLLLISIKILIDEYKAFKNEYYNG